MLYAEIVPYLLDAGNIVFFVATLPQLYRTYRNRYELNDLSIFSFVLMSVATLFFLVAGLIIVAWFTIALTSFNIIYNCVTIYWIFRSR